MEAFQTALDALTKESKEQITQVLDMAATAVLQAHIVPHRLAVAIAQRFTPARVESAYPVLCVLDAALVRTASKVASPSPSSSSSAMADQALAAVLKEFWEVAATGVFTAVHDYGVAQPAWREKCLRMVRRWKQRKLVKDDIADALVLAMEKGDAATEPSTSEGLDGSRLGSSGKAGTAAAKDGEKTEGLSGRAGSSTTEPPTRAAASSSSSSLPTPAAMTFTAVQAQAFRTTLQACMSALEALPAPRRTLYLDLLHQQHFRTPTKTAFAFYEELLNDLRREVTAASSPSAATGGASAANAERHGRGDDASAGHAREALGKFLDQLHSGGPEESAAGRGRTGGAGAAPAITVVRYANPLYLDIYAKQPLSQRGPGVGVLQRKAEHGNSSNAFYASFFPKPVSNAQRPFRIPATRQMHGGAVRLWFPRSQEWAVAQDMADLGQYASRNIMDKDRKRTREGEA